MPWKTIGIAAAAAAGVLLVQYTLEANGAPNLRMLAPNVRGAS